jgi:hypothetical protein
MTKLVLWRSFVGLVAILGTGACGGRRELTAVSVSPGSADAQNSGGQVQFVASGTFTQAPRTAQLTSADIGWCVGSADGTCPGNINSGAIVDSNGLARCQPGFQGTVTLLAGKAKTAQVNPDGPYSLRVFGAAQLVCP